MKLLLILFFIILIITGVLIFYYFRFTSQLSKTQPVATSEPDVFSPKNWNEYETHGLRVVGNSLEISNLGGSTEQYIGDASKKIKINPRGFELQTKIRVIIKANPEQPAYGYIVLNNNDQIYDQNKLYPLNIRIGVDNNSYLNVNFYDLANIDYKQRVKDIITLQENIKLSSGELRVEVIGSGLEERWNFYDGATGNLLVGNIKMPRPFLLPDRENEIYPGFYVVSGSAGIVATLSVDYWKIENK